MAVIYSDDRLTAGRTSSKGGTSTGIAYSLWLLAGPIGAHRLYLGRTGTAMLQAALCIGALVAEAAAFRLALLAPLPLWLTADLFWMGTMLQDNRAGALRRRVGVLARRGPHVVRRPDETAPRIAA